VNTHTLAPSRTYRTHAMAVIAVIAATAALWVALVGRAANPASTLTRSSRAAPTMAIPDIRDVARSPELFRGQSLNYQGIVTSIEEIPGTSGVQVQFTVGDTTLLLLAPNTQLTGVYAGDHVWVWVRPEGSRAIVTNVYGGQVSLATAWLDTIIKQ
jgi:hypothetical protein